MKDAIDFASVQIVGGSPDVHAWPVSAELERVNITIAGVQVDFTKRRGADRWPDVRPPNWDGDLQYTLWIVVNIGGHWFTTGCIEYWASLEFAGGDITQPGQLPKNWYFHAPEMAGHQPAVGEWIGFFVTAGDQRVKDVHDVAARSNVVLVAFPAPPGKDFWFHDVTPTPEPAPTPEPNIGDDFARFFEDVDRLLAGMTAIVESNQQLGAKLDELRQRGLRVHL